ncbi:MAG: glycosyltransferase family 9 protein [Saprospiraceae bacterium]
MQKILLIQTAFIGDVILATALVEKLHRRFPEASIDFLLRKGNEGLLKNNPYLQNIIIWDKKKHKTRNLLKILHQIRREHYDAVINLQRFFSTGMLTTLSGAKARIGFDKNPWSFGFTKKVQHQFGTDEHFIHEIDRNTALIAHWTDTQRERPRLYPSEKEYQVVPAGQKYVCIAPTSVWYTKQLPPERWLALMERLPSDYYIYLLGGPGDYAACDAILQQSLHKNVINTAGKLNFLQSAALMSKSVMNYVNDSAPLHMASAMNAPVTAAFCSTVPRFGFTPLSENAWVVETKENLACKPCGLHGYKACPLGHFRCSHIEAEQLLAPLAGL